MKTTGPTTSPARRARGDRGAVAGMEVLPFAVLLFVAGTLLAANAWAVVDAKLTVSAAARQAARTYVEATDPATAPLRADQAARRATAGLGRDPRRVIVSVPRSRGQFTRCQIATVTVAYRVPAATLPFGLSWGSGITVRATHSEIVDPYRDDVPGEARC